MDTIERVLKLCNERGVSIARLERECGFGNGYLGKKKGSFPIDRLQKIADYFDVPLEYLVSGVGYYEDPETARIAQEIKDNEELKGLFSAARDASPKTLNTIHQMLLIMKRNERHDD